MDVSSPRFKSVAVTAGFSFWFFVITSSIDMFTLELFVVFVISILVVTQIFSKKISKGLDIIAIINTKIFLGILFVGIISVYGILFRLLQIDLLRLKKQPNSYWQDIDETISDETISDETKSLLTSFNIYMKKLNFEEDRLDSCNNVYDFRNVFAGMDNEVIYFDAGHMNRYGNEIIAENIYEKIFPIISKN